MFADDLQEIGLTEKEAKIYLASLELGETTIQRIAKKSGVKRATIYRIVDELKNKGLIASYRKKSGTVYWAENPKKLNEKVQARAGLMAKILPNMLAITNLIDKKPLIKYYEGMDEIKELYLETLNFPAQEIVAWESGTAYEQYGGKFWDEIYIPKRMKNKIWTRLIYSDVSIGKRHKAMDEKFLRQIRVDHSKNFKFEMQIKLFGGKYSAFISNEEMLGIIIESPKIFNTLKSIFEVHWRSLE